MGKQLNNFLRSAGVKAIPRNKFIRSFEGSYSIPPEPLEDTLKDFFSTAEIEKYKSLKNPPKLTRFFSECIEKRLRKEKEEMLRDSYYKEYPFALDRDLECRRKSYEGYKEKLANRIKSSDAKLHISCNFQDMYRGVQSAHWRSCMRDAYTMFHASYFADSRIGVAYVPGSKSSMFERVWLVEIFNKGIMPFGWQGQNKTFTRKKINRALDIVCKERGLTLYSPFTNGKNSAIHPFKSKEISHPDIGLYSHTGAYPYDPIVDEEW